MAHLLLVCYAGPKVGIGHLSRLLALAQELKKENKVLPEFLIFGDQIKKTELNNYKVHYLPFDGDFINSVKNFIDSYDFSMIIFDLYKNHNIKELSSFFLELKVNNTRLIAIDSLADYNDILDLIWIPSFNFDFEKFSKSKGKIKFGWDKFLIQKRFKHKSWNFGNNILVLTGGGDNANIGNSLPENLNQHLPDNFNIKWVKGPFSNPPKLPLRCRLNFTVYDSPEYLDDLILESNFVISVYGVSFFEVLQYGIPTVVFSPYGEKDKKELEVLSSMNVAKVLYNYEDVISGIEKLINNETLSRKYSNNAISLMETSGAQKLSKEIYALLNSN